MNESIATHRGRRQRIVWIGAVCTAFGLAAWIVFGVGHVSVQPGQQSALAERFTSGQAGKTSETSYQALTVDGSDGTWGRTDRASTLVLYDTEGTGQEVDDAEEYAIASGNLASHFGRVTAVPMADYTAAMMRQYDAVVYIGSSNKQDTPLAFYNDLIGGDTPVLWAGGERQRLRR